MFGYVRPAAGRLTEEDKGRFMGAYCGLCRVLGERYGQRARFILNYDLTFLSLLLWPQEGKDEMLQRRCPAHPLRPREVYPGNAALALSADLSVILSYHQLRDKLDDPGGGKAKYRCALALLEGTYRKAAGNRPAYDRRVREKLDNLHELEKARCPSLDQPAHAFAELLAGAAGEVEDPVSRRVLEQLLYHLGRWIYLVDAADDLKDDYRTGSYNPLLYRYELEEGSLTGEAKASLASTLDHSIRLMAAAYELGRFGAWSGLIESVLYEGLFGVGRAVLEGTFHAADWPRPGRNEEKL